MTPKYDENGKLVCIWVGREDTDFIDLLARIEVAQRARELAANAADKSTAQRHASEAPQASS